MKGKSVLKVEGGKLIKIFLDYGGKNRGLGKGKTINRKTISMNNRINAIKITGDFFVHPEEGIEMLEEELIGTELERKVLLHKIDNFFSKNRIELFGIDPGSLAAAIMGCIGGSE